MSDSEKAIPRVLKVPTLALCPQADGRLKIGSSGVFWKKSQGGKTVEVAPKGESSVQYPFCPAIPEISIS